jgi:ankyrin repeat protein
MATIKSFTDLSQSKKLAEILPLETADMFLAMNGILPVMSKYIDDGFITADETAIPCWSLAALLDVLSEIKPQVYTPILFPSEGKWILQFAEYGHGNVCEVTCDNPVDACVVMIEKLHELNLI